MSFKPLVSVVIPTKNGESTIYRCLKSIANQTYDHVEVIILDSGSTDQTISIAAKFPFVRVVNILPHTFNHGTTRNLGVQEARGEYVLMTVQDAYATTDDWIETMLTHFLHDIEVVGVCGQQVVPHEEDKNPHEWFRPFSKPVPRIVHFEKSADLNSLSQAELHQYCGWDDVNAMYKREMLLAFPFEEVSFGEDMRWAKQAVIGGKKIVYEYNARVFHYHHSTYDYTYQRTFTVLYYTYKNFGYLKEIRFNPLQYIKVIYRNFKYQANFNWILFNWNKMRASAKAYADVKEELRKGEAALDQLHFNICGKPPQGIQNKKTG